uniref:Uncharacterized protein n=1 Tax=Nelumbo nucifera TaxID=4432 RepID=A0A822Y6A7_NELNU|nr:TPA_asm: hypothetical protein HUJ06_030992 [Nelumbo nucifera]
MEIHLNKPLQAGELVNRRGKSRYG